MTNLLSTTFIVADSFKITVFVYFDSGFPSERVNHISKQSENTNSRIDKNHRIGVLSVILRNGMFVAYWNKVKFSRYSN